LEPEVYSELLRQFPEQRTDDRQVILDYDSNSFSFTDWEEAGLISLCGPLDDVISAYSGALRKKNSTQTYLNKKVFIGEIERICKIGPMKSQQGNEQIPSMDLQL